MTRWSHGQCQGGVTIDDDGCTAAIILVDGHTAYSTALKRARMMVKRLNAGEVALSPAKLSLSDGAVVSATKSDA